MDGLPELTIGEVARRAGVATSSIRYYERIGLLPDPDRLHGQRRYDAGVLGKLGFIGVAQSAGFKLREIKALIDGVDSAGGMGDQMRLLSSRKLEEVQGAAGAHARDAGLARGREGMRLRNAGRVLPVPHALTEDLPSPVEALRIVRVEGRTCRRPPAA